MNKFVVWLGPTLRRTYNTVLRRPANWRMITMLASLDEEAERKAEAAAPPQTPANAHHPADEKR
jgi:hypothetical protein